LNIIGSIDRVLAGVFLLAIPYTPVTAAALAGLGNWIWLLPTVGAILILTAIFSFCPAYAMLGIPVRQNERETSVPITTFSPVSSLIGGALIGLSAVMLMVFQGKIAGISGIASRLLPPYGDFGFLWRFAFVIGLIVAPFAVKAFGVSVRQTVSSDFLLLAGAGLLVGFGTVWGSGCTSGHSVCGIARLSPRSIVATLVFMAAAVATVFITRHVI